MIGISHQEPPNEGGFKNQKVVHEYLQIESGVRCEWEYFILYSFIFLKGSIINRVSLIGMLSQQLPTDTQIIFI